MIIVTGGAGFIGSNLVSKLNSIGRNDVVIVDDLETGDKWKNIAKRRFLDIVPIKETNLFLDSLDQVDCVFHLGANSSTTATDADEILKTNLRSSFKWWNWCTNNQTQFIYASSAATYGDGSHGFSDQTDIIDDILTPLNLYGWSKHAFDRWVLQRVSDRFSPPNWAGLKFFNVYGPNEYHKGSMKSLVAKNTYNIIDGRDVMLFRSHNNNYTDGGQLRDFVYVDDCVSVMTWLFEHRSTVGIFNVGSGIARSFRDLIRAIEVSIDKEAIITYVDMPETIRNNYQYFTQADMRKLYDAGFKHQFKSLEDGVADYVKNYLLKSNIYK